MISCRKNLLAFCGVNVVAISTTLRSLIPYTPFGLVLKRLAAIQKYGSFRVARAR